MPISAQFRPRLLQKLTLLYGTQAEETLARIDQLASEYADLRTRPSRELWNQQSVMLITYGDQIREPGKAALEAQRQFLIDYRLDDVISGIHILPFYPYSSDDGFSVIDYRAVNPDVGQWSDVHRLSQSFDMMFDFVVNHCSRENDWFRRFAKCEPGYRDYFLVVDPATDLSAVTRPRSTPLLTPIETEDGVKHVWTTFSADQVDLNFASPDVLVELLDVLLAYLRHGARAIRLDAIGFLWKQIGTSCMHLPETHAVVKLMRDVVDDLAPGTVLITETNVPHAENVSYFGDGDEAHAVYQFSLAPLLLDALLTGDAGPLRQWLANLEFPGRAMTYLNFTASHDGIGVRPLEGLVSQERLDRLVDAVHQRRGLVSMRSKPDGSQSPYELNITYLSAVDSPAGDSPERLAQKFLATQAIMLSLRGIPGVYFHSLVGTPNYHEGVARTKHNRTINRRKFTRSELDTILSNHQSTQRRVLDGYRRLLAARVRQPAFHPDAEQVTLDTDWPGLVALERTSPDSGQRILVLANLGEQTIDADLAAWQCAAKTDLVSGEPIAGNRFELTPFSFAWLSD